MGEDFIFIEKPIGKFLPLRYSETNYSYSSNELIHYYILGMLKHL